MSFRAGASKPLAPFHSSSSFFICPDPWFLSRTATVWFINKQKKRQRKEERNLSATLFPVFPSLKLCCYFSHGLHRKPSSSYAVVLLFLSHTFVDVSLFRLVNHPRNGDEFVDFQWISWNEMCPSKCAVSVLFLLFLSPIEAVVYGMIGGGAVPALTRRVGVVIIIVMLGDLANEWQDVAGMIFG